MITGGPAGAALVVTMGAGSPGVHGFALADLGFLSLPELKL